MRLRTVKQFWREMREADPNNAMGLTALKSAVADGTIRSYRVGRRSLIDADTALNELLGAEKRAQRPGEVRRVEL